MPIPFEVTEAQLPGIIFQIHGIHSRLRIENGMNKIVKAPKSELFVYFSMCYAIEAVRQFSTELRAPFVTRLPLAAASVWSSSDFDPMIRTSLWALEGSEAKISNSKEISGLLHQAVWLGDTVQIFALPMHQPIRTFSFGL